jgi:hypothetical protein
MHSLRHVDAELTPKIIAFDFARTDAYYIQESQDMETNNSPASPLTSVQLKSHFNSYKEHIQYDYGFVEVWGTVVNADCRRWSKRLKL